MDEDNLNLSDTDRKEAYNEMIRAKDRLEEAADILGARGPGILMSKGDEEDVPADIQTAFRAMSNAYSHLDNGRAERLLPENDHE